MENALVREESEAVSSSVIAESDILAERGGWLAVYSMKRRKEAIARFRLSRTQRIVKDKENSR